jgi:hypothetical protein
LSASSEAMLDMPSHENEDILKSKLIIDCIDKSSCPHLLNKAISFVEIVSV